MLFSYKWLQEYIKNRLPQPEKLADLLTFHSFEVESIKRKGSDWVFDIPINPNRGDCLSYIGLAREGAVLVGSKMKLPKDEDIKIKRRIKRVNLKIEDKRDCSRYMAGVISGVKVKPSPSWLSERLITSGVNSINNLVDITNYVMLESGQPLHIFDFDKIKNGQLIVRRARKGEKIVTLDNKEYQLNKNILVIADKDKPLSLAGIKGGQRAAITSSTQNVVLESANFNPGLIRSISRQLNLRTDASWRFEHGVSLEQTSKSFRRALSFILNLAGGELEQIEDSGYKKHPPEEIKLDFDYVNSLLGVKIAPKKVVDILQSLSFKILKVSQRNILVLPPYFRLDISCPEDLIEEVGRIYGYEKIQPIFPEAALVSPERNEYLFWANTVREIFKNLNFSEVYNHSFINEEDKKNYQYNDNLLIEVVHPLSSEFKYLRPSLIPGLIKNVILNSKYFNEIDLFEIGKVFFKNKKIKTGYEEKNILSGLVSKRGNVQDFRLREDGFYLAKGVVDNLLKKMGLLDVWYDDYKPILPKNSLSEWEEGQSAEIKVGQTKVGFLGEFSSVISSKLRLSRPVTIFSFDFDKLIKLSQEENDYQPISPFPEASRDISLLLPREVKVVNVLNQINLAGGKIVKDVDLFDIYEEAGENKKSLAFHIIFQAPDRTLTSEEVDKAQDKIIRSLESNPGWKVRR